MRTTVADQRDADTQPEPVQPSGVGFALALALVSAVPIAVYIWIAAHRWRYPFELEWLEGGAVELTRRVASGGSIYAAPTVEVTPWPYPPLYFWLSAQVGRVTGQGFVPLRLVSIAASIAVLVLIAVLVRQHGGRWVAALAGAGIYAATYVTSGRWADTARVDSLFMALTLATAVAASRAHTVRAGATVGLLVVAAVSTKQTALLPCGLVVLWLVVSRRRVGLTAVGVSVVGVAAGVLWGAVVTDGWFIDYVILELAGHDLNPGAVLGYWSHDLIRPMAPVLVMIGVTIVMAVRGHGAPATLHQHSVLPFFVVGLLMTGWLGRVHTGAAPNVVMPAYAAAAVVAALAIDRLSAVHRRLAVVGLVAIAIQMVLLLRPPSASIPTVADGAAGREVIATVSALPGRVLMLNHPAYLTMAGKPTNGHYVAMIDVLRAGPSRAKSALEADLASEIGQASVVVLGSAHESWIFEPYLSAQFTRVSTGLTRSVSAPGGQSWPVFTPVGGAQTRPTVVWVRRGVELDPNLSWPW